MTIADLLGDESFLPVPPDRVPNLDAAAVLETLDLETKRRTRVSEAPALGWRPDWRTAGRSSADPAVRLTRCSFIRRLRPATFDSAVQAESSPRGSGYGRCDRASSWAAFACSPVPGARVPGPPWGGRVRSPGGCGSGRRGHVNGKGRRYDSHLAAAKPPPRRSLSNTWTSEVSAIDRRADAEPRRAGRRSHRIGGRA